MMSYWKSTMTNDIYAMAKDWEPKFDGWVRATEEEYKEFCKKNGYKI